VLAASTGRESRALCEVGAVDERLDEARNLAAVRRAVRVHHHDDVSGAGGKAGSERVALAAAGLADDLDQRIVLLRDGRRSVQRVAVDEHELEDVVGQGGENVRQVLCLVERRNNHTDGRGSSRPVLASCGVMRRAWAPAAPEPTVGLLITNFYLS